MPRTIMAEPGTAIDIAIGNKAILSVDTSGNVTLAPATGGLLSLTGVLTGGIKPTVQAIAGDGAITIPTDGTSVVLLSKGSAAAITIAAPTVAQNGTIIFVRSLTGFAHVITCATDGFNAKGSSGTATAATTFTGLLMLYADAGHWYALSQNLWTIA